jgi:propanediol dehydratase small subunit
MSDAPGLHTRSGRPVASVTVETIVEEGLGGDEIRPDADMLRHQAAIAEASGNRQLAENLLRGAELVEFDDPTLLRFYDALRPGRSTAAELATIAAELEASGAVRCAGLVREACEAYRSRGLLSSAG